MQESIIIPKLTLLKKHKIWSCSLHLGMSMPYFLTLNTMRLPVFRFEHVDFTQFQQVLSLHYIENKKMNNEVVFGVEKHFRYIR